MPEEGLQVSNAEFGNNLLINTINCSKLAVEIREGSNEGIAQLYFGSSENIITY